MLQKTLELSFFTLIEAFVRASIPVSRSRQVCATYFLNSKNSDLIASEIKASKNLKVKLFHLN